MIVAIAILVAFVIGAGACAWLTPRVPHFAIIGGGLALVVAGSVLLMLVALFADGKGSLATCLVPIGISFAGVGLTVPVSTAKAIVPSGDNAGAASPVPGFLRMGIAALGTVAMGALHMGGVYDIPIVFLALSVTAVVLFCTYLGLRGKPPKAATH